MPRLPQPRLQSPGYHAPSCSLLFHPASHQSLRGVTFLWMTLPFRRLGWLWRWEAGFGELHLQHRLDDIGDMTVWMIEGGVPVQGAAGWFVHQAATKWARERSGVSLTLCHVIFSLARARTRARAMTTPVVYHKRHVEGGLGSGEHSS